MTDNQDHDRKTRASILLDQMEAGAAARISESLDAFDPDAFKLIFGFAFADVVGRDGIDLKTREMLTVAMLGAQGTAPAQLDFHMRAALECGVARHEIVEIVYQIAVYAGVPAAMNAITAAKKAFEALET
ncbi:carboxymuconolactone decarboxylase family protein [Ruegeria arenilitoris]|uniref:carboxymuconolactone decarboxylase family protein n=1 Tax=Ruegeria arenilitoris TaxID=1173585 RepID=UPI00147BF66D|nr:carboxymuconolactone decarboxylase family protein [Ruegeria arenilitoris]